MVEAINLQDASHLSKFSSISLKTAEKIISALKGKVEIFALSSSSPEKETSQNYTDAFDTLITLGYNPIAIRQVLDTVNTQESTSNIVKKALKKL